LAHGRSARCVLGQQQGDGLHQRQRACAVAQAPTRHRIGLRHAVDDACSRPKLRPNAPDRTRGGGGAGGRTLGKLIETAVAPYRSDAHKGDIAGPELILSDAHALPLGLVLHELATNAVKYGAWSQPGGLVKVHWTIDDDRQATVNWEEHCSFTPPDHPADERAGFGTKLAESSARQLQGSIERSYAPHGLVLRLVFPVGPLPEPEAAGRPPPASDLRLSVLLRADRFDHTGREGADLGDGHGALLPFAFHSAIFPFPLPGHRRAAFFPGRIPGVPRSTTKAEMPFGPDALSVTAITTITCPTPPCVMKALAPFSTQPVDVRTAVVRIAAAGM